VTIGAKSYEVIAPGLLSSESSDVDELEAHVAPGVPIRLCTSWCRDCDRYEFPQRKLCPQCGQPASTTALNAEGVVRLYTAVNHPPPGAAVPVPYVVAIVDFPEGISILGIVADLKNISGISKGDRIHTVAHQIGDKVGFAFRLA
jgi:uncharacterized OB-fold protein